jgi:hypothetical protein
MMKLPVKIRICRDFALPWFAAGCKPESGSRLPQSTFPSSPPIHIPVFIGT